MYQIGYVGILLDLILQRRGNKEKSFLIPLMEFSLLIKNIYTDKRVAFSLVQF